MRTTLLTLVVAALLAQAVPALPADTQTREVSRLPAPDRAHIFQAASSRAETLWIFDADFEDLLGDNAGWTSEDRSGTLAIENYWHKDTIRINGFEWLGDSTWWCGTNNPCWRQPRGYGNNWYQLLYRDFPEVALHTDPGDTLILEYDQRIAMENDYDYGYTDVSADGGETWTTVLTIDNPGFAGTPGFSQDWDSVNPVAPGHISIDLGDYAGLAIAIRFRFESDGAYSSQDQWDNPPFHSVLDGAWQLDNVSLYDSDPSHNDPFWLDDCESPGDNGWVHDGIPAHGQTGVTFWRGLYGTDIWTNRPFTCDEQAGWMYAAVDPLTSRMVDGEYAWLLSPPINIEGANKLVGQWDMWVDLPRATDDIFNLDIYSGDNPDCIEPHGGIDPPPGWWYGGPFWGSWTDDWDAFAGNNWLTLLWTVLNDDPPAPGVEHMGGIFLNRQRVGIPTGDPGTVWDYSVWYRLHDWFQEQLADALVDSAVINVRDDDGIVSVMLIADNGATQTSYACRRQDPEGNDWVVPPPATEMIPGSEIHYYLEAQDGVGTTSLFPSGAPDARYEFSILPIHGSVSDPCVLLVDKHDSRTPGEDRSYRYTSELFYREALEILGHEFDVFDVDVPSAPIRSDGPDTCGMKYYDTQIWFTNESNAYTLIARDQRNLISWLGQAGEGKERNLLLTGNGVGYELVEAGDETLGFYTDWLATEFLDDAVGEVEVDSVPGLRDFAGGFDFMTYDDQECVLRGGCPELAFFDVIQPYPGAVGAELVAEYVKVDLTTRPAGVAYTDSTGYQTVTLGFGIEFMSDAPLPNGHFAPGASDRVDFVANIMEYFQKDPTGPGTGVESGGVFVTKLGNARPNPFNPRTTFAYSLAGRSRVTIRVHDLAGRVVRTLVDGEKEPGEHAAIWDGTTDTDQRAASGVYFVKMEGAGDSGGFSETGKVVMLK
ncbi:MAG: FlgD immunoglobulin-like domain containing protein [Candidatus Eisenbacteria bacterium]